MGGGASGLHILRRLALVLFSAVPLFPFGVVAGAAFFGYLPHAAPCELALAGDLQGTLGDGNALAELCWDGLRYLGEPAGYQGDSVTPAKLAARCDEGV